MDRPPAAQNSFGSSPPWTFSGPPLRPCPADIATYERIVRQFVQSPTPKVLMWGVTPEIAEMNWPSGTDFLAIDPSPEAIEQAWPGDVPGERRALCGNWFDQPAQLAKRHVIIGDGAFSLLKFPDGYLQLAQRARELLTRNGVLILRPFLAAAKGLSTEAIYRLVWERRFGNFDLFKISLAQSLVDANRSVDSSRVYDSWAGSGISEDALVKATGWPREAIRTMDHFRDQTQRMSFPRLKEFLEILSHDLDVLEVNIPDYEMGDAFPIVAFRKRRATSR